MNKKLVFVLIFVLIVVSACHKQNDVKSQSFELYLLADEQLLGGAVKEEGLADLVLAEAPLINTNDIIIYVWDEHRIKLRDESYQKIVALFSDGVPIAGKPFVILSYGERIYAGAFWTLLSSLSFDGVTIMRPGDHASREITITLGYPTEAFFTGEDPRDDTRLLHALEDAGVLR